jgi:hypothetical protein
MNPPLHDVALHHHQRVNFPRWFLLHRTGLSITTALTVGSVGCPLEAAAFSESVNSAQFSAHSYHSQAAVIAQAMQEDEFIREVLTNPVVELEELELDTELEYSQFDVSASQNTIEVTTWVNGLNSVDVELRESTGESVVEEPEPAQRISQTQSEYAQSEEASLTVVDAPMITTQSSFNPSILSDRTSDSTVAAPLVAQSTEPTSDEPTDFSEVSYSSQDLENPLVQVQGVYTLQGNESSARGRVSASYAITPNVMIGGTVDVTTGDAFSDSPEEGIDLNELYIAVSPTELPNLRFIAGMLDLTSYFDRNSFAKDAATHFLNPVFQSNPALTAAGLGSRPAILMNWSVADPVEVKITGFSSDRDLGDFALDGFAGEVGVRLGNLIVRGTYITSRDAGQNSGFREIFQIERDDDEFGLDSGDREQAIGVNAEYFIPEIDLGLFARYGWYENLDIDRSSSTFSVGFNLLDLFMQEDRLGLAYGQQLSNSELRRDEGNDYPDVWELFYDFQITPNLRAGVTLQSVNQFSETIGGFRIRADFDSGDFRRLFR